MQINIKTVVIVPAETQGSKSKTAYPVVYLLHGYGGNYANWITKMPALVAYANAFKMIIVCPDGKNSWYVNNPFDSSIRYESFITKELIGYIESHYPAIPKKEKRAITGLSMGGHGAFMLGLKYPQYFAAAGSMSGVLDLKPVLNNYLLEKTNGDSSTHASFWQQFSVSNIADTISNGNIKILFDCGTSDAFITSNRALHEKLTLRKIDHDYTERNGGHNWTYWPNALPYHLLFFRKIFYPDL